jgi:hypothetical protein
MIRTSPWVKCGEVWDMAYIPSTRDTGWWKGNQTMEDPYQDWTR